MRSVLRVLVALAIAFSASAVSQVDATLRNWQAPPFWTPPVIAQTDEPAASRERIRPKAATDSASSGPTPLPFVAITPCRLADTRAGSGFPSGYGPPSIAGGAQRSFTVAGQCGIPADAQAVSFNFAVWAPVTRGDLRVFPAGGGTPTVSTLNWEANILALANAAVVPLGTGGAITVQVDGTGTIDLFIDVNGYYSPLGVVNSVNTLSAAVTLAAGANTTITPSGQTLTISSAGSLTGVTAGTGISVTGSAPSPTVLIPPSGIAADRIASGQVVKSVNGLFDGVTLAGAGGASVSQLGQTITVTAPTGFPAGSSGQTLRHDGSTWVANSFLTNTGTAVGIGVSLPNDQLEITGNLRLPATTALAGRINIGVANPFLHAYGNYNTFVGPWAGNFTMTGQANTGIGNMSLYSVSTGAFNTAVGNGSLSMTSAGTYNTAVGSNCLQENTTASANTAVGGGALYGQSFSNSGTPWLSENTAIGYRALYANQPTAVDNGSGNTAVGSFALGANTTGANNTAEGRSALASNTTASRNTAVGVSALFTQSYSNSGTVWDSENTAVGHEALYLNQPTATNNGTWNTAVGVAALRANTTGYGNTAVGRTALNSNETGVRNVAVGWDTLKFSSSGNDNTAVGWQAFGAAGSASASGVTAVGAEALPVNHGEQNTAVGLRTLYSNSTGTLNVALGAGASYLNDTGSNNTAVGMEALKQNVAGSGNVGLGYRAGYNETGSNRLYIANSDTNTIIYGQFDNHMVAINATDPLPPTTLDVNGLIRSRTILAWPGIIQVCADPAGILGVCVPSDARLKTNVVGLSEEMDVLSSLGALRGVRFDWDRTVPKVRSLGARREVGVIAQEVETVLPEVVTTGPDGYKSVDYPKLTAFLIEVAKAQQREIGELKARLDALDGQAAKLR